MGVLAKKVWRVLGAVLAGQTGPRVWLGQLYLIGVMCLCRD